MADQRVINLARILVDYSTRIEPGDRVLIEGTTAAEPLIQEIYRIVLERGGHPHPLIELAEEEELFFTHANEDQLKQPQIFRQLAYKEFEARIKIHSNTNTRALSKVNPSKQTIRNATLQPILETQMKRGAAEKFKWVTTLFPTQAYSMEAGIGMNEFENLVYRACHADRKTKDPVAHWEGIQKSQQEIVERFDGHDKVSLRGPNVDLTLSIKGRKFKNAAGINNMPDGEIYTSPVETSVNGWVRFTYPAITGGRVVEGIELTFVNGQVLKASSKTNQDYLLQMLDSDKGARFTGEFGIGTNYEIDRFTGNILFDEKIGGSFHMALGAGYPETGSKNTSMIHWDMICDMRKDSQIFLDGDVIYKNGEFVT